ncbi:outer membrane protein assembly factor BamC [Thiothrix nivea]|uniref:NlpBDapX family lipoprotein n=1 Tax=Thiothrix nivea (strain ATCC 35100 / DSM 5205 / JP2) TaxID=870187 RepID=A0A656HGQ7_THINJ|nr:outer membrane protein assembly factor BamC [Thiothrix nivea]EIJ35392.1 NlpBDapX family lipoprotein [Thiothrix nivea DSM 5205]
MNPMTLLLSSRRALVIGSVLVLSACSGLSIDDVGERVDYKNNKSINSLEVPPDLNAPDYDATYAAIPGGAISASALMQGQAKSGVREVLPTNAAIQLMREGNVRWLQVAAPAEAVWPKLHEFWQTMGVAVKRDEPRIGVMETDWAENRAELPLDGIRKALGKAFANLYDAGSRDRFKIRLERPSAQVTNVFLSHERAEENVSGTGVKWEYVPAKPELEAEMLNRLMAFLQGGSPAQSATAPVAEVRQVSVQAAMTQLEGGQPALVVAGAANDTWIRTGVMLGRIGMSIEGQQRANGVYLASYNGGGSDRQQGFFSRLFKSERDMLKVGSRYQVQISDAGNRSLITVGDEEGNPLKPDVAKTLLERLKSEFER